jgi:hypothetical protein
VSSAASMDTFICVHRRDIDYLLELTLKQYELNFEPAGELVLICNDLPYLKRFMDERGHPRNVHLSTDADWLSTQEMTLPGWYRQQIIKLRSHQFCDTQNFCNLGADTLLLQPISDADLVHDEMPVLYYTRHRVPDLHFCYEWLRLRNVAKLLQVRPARSRRYVDFINDLFCFNRTELLGLDEYLTERYGDNYFYALLKDMGEARSNQKRFGEWTLYSTFVLDHLRRDVELRDTGAGFLRQLHDRPALARFGFDTKVAHFVGKDFDLEYIQARLPQPAPGR